MKWGVMQERNKKHYLYKFDNGEAHHMTPPEAFRYSYTKKIKIIQGPNYQNGKQIKRFDGFGYHDGLQRSFKGPKDYRDYLKANGIEEWGSENPPVYSENNPPVWTEELIRKAINEHKIEIGSILAEALLSGEVQFPEG